MRQMRPHPCYAMIWLALSVMHPLTAASDPNLRRVFCSYWTTQDGYTSVVELHNNLIGQSIVVQPVLLSPAGVRSELDPIQLGPLQNASLDLGTALAKTSARGLRSGSAVFEYSYKNRAALLAEIYVTEASTTLSYTVAGSEVGASTKNQHGVFWLPDRQAKAYITLQNASATAEIHVSASFEGTAAQPPFLTANLAPNTSQVVEVPLATLSLGRPAAEELFGAIVLKHDAPDGALHASGWIEEEQTGYSNTMTFYDPGRSRGTSLYGPQVFVGQRNDLLASGKRLTIDSYLVLLNTSSTAISPRGQFYFESGGEMTHISLPLTSLAPGQSSLVALGAMQNAGLIPASVSMGSIVIGYDGPEAALMGRVYGIANDPTYGFYIALDTDTPARLNEVYWTTAGDANSFLTVTNFGAQPDQVSITFTFSGGTWPLPKVTLAPFQSTTVNVRDWKGHGLPANVEYGGFRVLGNSPVKSKLVAKEHIISEDLGVSAPFYNNPPPYVTGFVVLDQSWNNTVDSLTMSPGDSTQVGATLLYSDGSSALVYTDVSSTNTSVATASELGFIAWTTVAAQNLGSTQITWQSPPVPSDFQLDLQVWTVQVPVQVSQCFAQLKYRPVTVALGITVGNHSFWWIQTTQNSTATQYVMDAGPSASCLAGCGFLNDWVVMGSTGHYAEDNQNASLAWAWPNGGGVSAVACPAATNLYNFGVNWPQNTTPYVLGGAPNSNTFTHWAANAAGLAPTAPPNAPGW